MTNHLRDNNSLAWEALAKVETTKMKRIRRYEAVKVLCSMSDIDETMNRRISPSTNHLHAQQPESAERSVRLLVQMLPPSSLQSILLLDASYDTFECKESTTIYSSRKNMSRIKNAYERLKLRRKEELL